MAWECACGVSNRDSRTKCAACGTPKGMVWTPEGFRTPDEAATAVHASPAPASTKAVKIAWVVALVYGGFTVGIVALLPFFKTLGLTALQATAGMGLVGIFYIALGLTVRRGDRFAIWCLVALQTFEVVARILTFQFQGLLIPIVVLILFIRGALHLQRTTSAVVDSDNWTHVLYEVAFLQAILTAFLVAWSLVLDPARLGVLVGVRISVWQTLDVVILIGFGIAAWKRQVWAGYALMLYQIGNISFVMMAGMNPSLAIGMAFLYGFGAFHLHRLHGPITGWGRAAVALVGALVVVTGASLRLKREAAIQTVTDEGVIESELQRLPTYQEIKDSDPQAYETITAIVHDGVRKGQTGYMIASRIQPVIMEVFDKYLPHASDDAIVAFATHFVRRIMELTQISPDLCYQYLFPQEYGLPDQDDKTLQEASAAMAAVIRTATHNPQPSPDASQSEALLESVRITLHKEYGDDLFLLANPLGESVDKKKVCTMMVAMYEEVLKMPKKESGMVLRYLLSSE